MADGVASRFDVYDVANTDPRYGTPAYTASDERLLDAVPMAPGGGLLARPGIRPGGGFEVTIGGTPESVTLAPGLGVVTDAVGGGSYRIAIPNPVTIQFGARPSTGQSRIDELVVVIRNDEVRLTDNGREVDVQVITGTPGVSPVAPTVPAGALRIRRLTVPASGGIAQSLSPQRTVAAGGVLPVASQAEEDAISPVYDGFFVYREDLKVYRGRINGAWANVRTDANDTDWATPSLTSTFTNRFSAAFRRRGGEVVARGALSFTGTPSFTTAFTLPAGFRPADTALFAASTNSATSLALQVLPTGQVQVWSSNATGAYIPLTGIRFEPAA